MMKQILIFAAAAASLFAQSTHYGNAFQHPGWIAAPGSAPTTVHMSHPEGEQSGPVVGRPFSGIEVRHSRQTLSDGTHVDSSDTTKVYRDVQGRLRVESPQRVEIFDPVAGFEYDLRLESKTYKKVFIGDKNSFSVAVVGSWSFTSSSSDSPSAAGSKERPGTEHLTPQLISGINAKGLRVTSTIPAGSFGNDRDIKVVNERWYSDDLQVLLKSSNSDPRFGVSSYELTNIVQAPPDPSLFQVPLDYKQQTATDH